MNRRLFAPARVLCATALVLGLLLTFSAHAATRNGVNAITPGHGDLIYATGHHLSLKIPIYKSRIVELSTAVTRVSVGDPDIADVLLINPFELYVLGKDLGSTNIMLWSTHGNLITAVSVTVTHNLVALRAKLAAILPHEDVHVMSAHRNIVLFGHASSVLDMDAAIELAKSYLQQAATAKKKIMFKVRSSGGNPSGENHVGKVINLIQVAGPQEVMLQVRVAEVQINAVKHLNPQVLGLFNNGKWVGGALNGAATFPPAHWTNLGSNLELPMQGQPGSSGIVGPPQQSVEPAVPSISTAGLFGSYFSGSFIANAVLDAFAQNGLAKILAEPTLTTESGQRAQFLSGGSFPIPVPEQNGTIGIVYKNFGVKLSFLPIVLSDNRINLKIDVSVSQLTATNSLTISPITSSSVFAVPSITERRAQSTVSLADGQTIGIAGLDNDSLQSAAKKFPGLGSLPILGELFRSQDFQEGKTELVILVTPRLARPLPAGPVHLPTDNITAPSNLGFFLLGKLHGHVSKHRVSDYSTAKPAATTSARSANAPSSTTHP